MRLIPRLAIAPLVVVGSACAGCAGEVGATATEGASATGTTGASATEGTAGTETTAGTGATTLETEGTDPGSLHSVGGQVEGLLGAGLRLLNLGGDPLEIAADGPSSFSFSMPLAEGSAYEVSVEAQPSTPEQRCSVTAGSGTIGAEDVDDVVVRCRTPIRHVVMIGVDGLGGAYLEGAATPVLDSLIAGSAATSSMQNALPTMSAPNWMSMIAGSSPDQHGVLSNSWSPGDSVPTPTIFAAVREHLPAAKIGIFHDWDAFDELVEPGVASHIESPGDEVETMAAAIAWMKAERPELLFIHLDHVDHAGHFHGWGGDDYVEAVEAADALIGEALSAVEEAGMADHTAIVISADHGGDGLSHGDDTSLERPIPLIVHGPQIAPVLIDRELRIFDIAATVAALLDAPAPTSWLGRPIAEGLIDVELPPAPDTSAELVEVMEYEWRYDDSGSGAFADLSLWRPLPPAGYVSLGDVAVVGHDAPDVATWVVREAPGITARPLGYERIWDDEGSLGKNDVAIWSPIPPLGFVCLGSVAAQVYDAEPSPELIRCVHRGLLVRGSATLTWTDEGSGAWEDAGLWTCLAGDEGGVAPRTFVSRRHHEDPGSARCWVFAERGR